MPTPTSCRSRHYRAPMRLTAGPDQPLSAVYLWLTVSEAEELRDVLNDLLADPRPEWHAHVSSSDYQTEVSVSWDDRS